MKKTLLGLLASASLVATLAHGQAAPDTLGRIKAAKAVNVAVAADAAPFSSMSGGVAVGYSIDLCKRVIAQIGRAVGEPDLKVNWMVGETPARLQMIAERKADLDCATTTQTLARMATVDFSSLIFIDAGGVVIRADSTINRFADLGGKKIAVLKGTTTESRLRFQLERSLVNATVIPVETAAAGLALLESGGADAYAGDKIKLVMLAAQAKDPAKLAMLTEDLSFEPYAIALPRGDAALRLEVNRALTKIYLSGEIETVFGQWLGKLGRPTGLLAAMYLLYSIPE